ncbi:DNA excision repair protein ERCC-6-like 2 isoform X2 [Xiphias gladius]|uniref:DNA excision repair protein ERCC-6-like 2 isoform X2 n=1 Tax=Xiphias gladius TaxID=8245 RepID=UPI001A995534|nr:DNA excision repair protein ERCC-6-like 2 isoform X2 [Xiphias gladius]
MSDSLRGKDQRKYIQRILMASTSAAEKAWRGGDNCLAPNPRDGTLQEGTIQRLASTSHSNDTAAWVILTDHSKDADEEEEEKEEAIPVSKPMRPDLNHFTQEKPVFPSSISDPKLCVPLELSDVDGDRVPYPINRYLRDYQREGIRFIYNSYIRSSGCILGDDMGLGKTVQVIGFLAAVLHKTGTWEDIENNRPQFLQSQIPTKQSKPNKVFLIVAPLSVLYNWKDELDTWGHFQCVVVHGLRKEEELARIKKGRIEIALTTYETLRLCLDQFNNIDWSAVVVDEAHKIKNPSSQITQAMKGLKCKIRIGLTGTILQNNLEELWCVMDWAVPGCLGSLGHFKNKYSNPIEQGQRHSVTKRALATGRKSVRALVRKISHWFLRRTKALIKEQLPTKNDRVVYCSLTDFQETVYQTVLDTEDVTLLLRSSEKCDCQSGRTRRSCCYETNSGGVKMKELYFSYLAILRKVANHVALLQSTAGTSKKQEKYLSAICQKVFQRFPDLAQRCKDEAFETLSDPMYSGKMKVLQKLLKYYLQKRDKLLLFSLSTKVLDVLESYCMAEGLDYSRLDGTTKTKERVQIVKEFNSSSHINLCLVSTMAGGLGLNFVGANVVVLFDPTWNPANDLQAIDRAYRIGQCRNVTVLRLISLGTVEEIIYLRQVYKQQLQCSVVGKETSRRYFESVQGHGVYKGELFGIKNLFRLQTQGTCLTRKILKREGKVEAGVTTTSTHTGEEKEEGRKGVSEPGDSPFTEGLVPNDEPAKDNRDVSKVPRGVLDFSSGSEEDEIEQRFKRKASNPSAVDGNRSGNADTGPGRMSLLQHGFSRFLERIKEIPELGEGDSSPGVEESPSDKDTEDHEKLRKNECTSSGIYKSSNTGNGAVCLPKLGTKTWEISSVSDREDIRNGAGGRQNRVSLLKENDDAARKRYGMKGWTNEEMTVDGGSDKNSPDKKPNKLKTTVPTVHRFESYSDESEDFDLGASTWSKKGTFNSHGRGQDRSRRHLDCNKKRQTTSVRNKARSKHTEAIETCTSSEDEHTPFKKGRSHLTSPQTERSSADMPQDGQRAATTERDIGIPRAVSFTGTKSQTSPASKGKDGTIDSVLGGLQEVVYTHSNQRVVGGSKAEELISRAAVRDVYERKMYSQVPANFLLGNPESLSASLPGSLPYPTIDRLEKPSVDHPVTFTSKCVHHTKHTTFIIGETPQAIRRQHLEDMAKKFRFPSVHQFVVEILRRNSTRRLAWLRQYYTSLNHPDLANTVTNNFPQSDSAQTSSTSAATSSTSTQTAATKSHRETRTPKKDVPKATKKPKYTQKNLEPQTKPKIPHNNVSVPQKKSRSLQKYVPEPQPNPKNPLNNVLEPQKKQKISQKNVLEPLSNVPSPESEEQEETVCSARGHRRTKRGSVSSSGAYRAGGGLGSDQASSRGLGSGKAAAFLNHTDRDTPSSPDVSHGRSNMLSKPTAQGRGQEQKLSSRTTFQGQRENSQTPSSPEQAPSASCNRSLLKDLIGDTSILDDLLKPKPRGAQQRSTPKTPPTFSVPVSTCVAKPSPSRITDNTDSGSTGLLDSLYSPSSHTPTTHQVNTPVQASKGGRKDFWDILNEGNEESINRLTDLAEVQRVCVNTNFSARSRSGEEESKSLWKTNEKFLWKK